MKALSKLQASIVVQAAAHDSVVDKFNERARMFVAAGALIAIALASGGAHAQSNQVLTPSNCAMVGATVGGVAGAASSDNNSARLILGALGALGGGALGNFLCAPKPLPSQDSSYQRAANYNNTNARGDGSVERTSPKMALSISESERLDLMSRSALDSKVAWKKALWDIQNAQSSGNARGLNTAKESESSARQSFENNRATFATTVARLNAGYEGMEPRAVGRYLEISASMLELDTSAKVNYDRLASRDEELLNRSPAYLEEAQRVARMRKS